MASLGSINFDKKVYSSDETDALLVRKQDLLHFDSAPTDGSENPVTSSGIKEYVDTQIEDALEDLGSALRYRGVVPTMDDLPHEGVEVGDVYTVEADQGEYVCTGFDSSDLPEWSSLGPTLAGYLTKEEASETYATKGEVRFEAGAGADSAVQKQSSGSVIGLPVEPNSSISTSSVTEGAGNAAGLKGYRYTDTGTVGNSLTFAVEPDGWAVKDVVSVINKSKYPDAGVIASIDGKTVTFESELNIGTTFVEESDFDSKCAYVSAKPDKGDVDLGAGAHAEGVRTRAVNTVAHAEGRDTAALGQYSHAEGRGTSAQYIAHAEGHGSVASGMTSHAEGNSTAATGNNSHSEGTLAVASGVNAHSENYQTAANGANSHAEGAQSATGGSAKPAPVTNFTNTGYAAHAEGNGTWATGSSSHAEGYSTVASALAAHAEGNQTVASGQNSHASGLKSVAEGYASTAMGRSAHAQHDRSFVWSGHDSDIQYKSHGAGSFCVSPVPVGASTDPATGFWIGGKSLASMLDEKADAKATEDALEAIRFKAWFPGGEAKSIADCTSGLKFDWANADSTNRTVSVLPFCNTPGENNSGKTGVVIIPPHVDHDGLTYTVVGVEAGYITGDNAGLTGIVAPTTVTTVGYGAFDHCTALASVSFPAATAVGGLAFNYCTSLASVSLPAATAVGERAFDTCTSLAYASLPAATTVGDYAFRNCSPLAFVFLPVATTVGDFAFSGCISLASVSLPAATGVDGAFYYCTALASVSLPASTAVGGSTFYHCNSLASVSLPVVTAVGDEAFSDCTSLASVSLPAATDVGKRAFRRCTSLDNIDFGPVARQSVPTLGTSAFPDLSQSGRTCRIVVPDSQFAAWTADENWAALTSKGYEFVTWSSTQPVIRDELAAVATSGSYNDLLNKPTIPTSFDRIVSPNGSASVVVNDGGTAVLKTEGTTIGDNDPLSDLADYLGLGDDATLDGVRQALGLSENATLEDAVQAVPASSEKTIATLDDLVPKLDADQRNVVPYAASADLTLDPEVAVYRLSPTGTAIAIPSPVTTALPATDGYYQFEIELAVPATATSLTAPSGWTWLTGFELPSSGYAGKTVCVSCRMDLRGNAVTASCWRVA